MIKYVRCIKLRRKVDEITEGKIYKVLKDSDDTYNLLNNFGGTTVGYFKDMFRELPPLEYQLYLAKERLKKNG